MELICFGGEVVESRVYGSGGRLQDDPLGRPTRLVAGAEAADLYAQVIFAVDGLG